MFRYLFILLLSFNFSFANENVVKTSELELFLFKVGFESLLKDVDITKDKSSLNENEIKTINEKIDLIMSELYKDKRVLLKDRVEQEDIRTFSKEELENLKSEIAYLKKEVQELKEESKEIIVKKEKVEDKLELNKIIQKKFEKTEKTSYAVYFVAYKDIEKTKKAVQEINKIIGSLYQIKIVHVRGFYSGVIFNLKTYATAREIKIKILKKYSSSYIKKID